MHLLSFAKGALALLAGGMLAVHVLEVVLLNNRLKNRPQP